VGLCVGLCVYVPHARAHAGYPHRAYIHTYIHTYIHIFQATAIGANNQAAQSILKQEYKDSMSLDDVVKLAIKVLNKSMDSTSLTAEKRKFFMCASFFPVRT
jgi:20S proteasome alpha/beta subunit